MKGRRLEILRILSDGQKLTMDIHDRLPSSLLYEGTKASLSSLVKAGQIAKFSLADGTNRVCWELTAAGKSILEADDVGRSKFGTFGDRIGQARSVFDLGCYCG